LAGDTVGRLVNAGYLVRTGVPFVYEAGPTVVDAVTPGGWPPETLAVPDHVPVTVARWNRQ